MSMLPESVKQTIRHALTQMGNGLGQFRSRSAQRLMIAEIAKTLTRDNTDLQRIIVVEGPTGTGKTLAYLLAGIPIAQYLQKRLMIASATVALQNQLIEKDIPQVEKYSGLTFSYEIAKGRGRYFCPKLALQQIDETAQIDALDQHDPNDRVQLRELFDAFDQSQWAGDKDTWKITITPSLWTAVSNDRHRCTAKYCEFFQRCPYFIARHKFNHADVIVANHDLVLADVALGSGVLLPKPEDTIYIFDEAHRLPVKAIEHTGAKCSIDASIIWAESLPNSLKRTLALIAPENNITQDTHQIREHALLLIQALKQVKQYLLSIPSVSSAYHTTDKFADKFDRTHRFLPDDISAALIDMSDNIVHIAHTMLAHFEHLKRDLLRCLERQSVNSAVVESLLTDVGLSLDRISLLGKLWHMLVTENTPDMPPVAKWMQLSSMLLPKSNENELTIYTAPVSAAAVLSDQLWDKCHGAVLTSATLTMQDDFSRFVEKTGLLDARQVNYLVLESAFDYAKSAILRVPKMQYDPTESRQHTQQTIDILPTLITEDLGVLVLFTASSQMNEVANQLSNELTHKLLVQGQLSNIALLKKHQQYVKQKQGSVIFGLASFAEGVDLPGALCTHVVIVRLPFSVPGSPIEATEREFIEANGGSYFNEIAMPEACVRLKQAVGRLLRSETDTGQITVLDNRLLNKRYGQRLLKSLPPMRLVVSDS